MTHVFDTESVFDRQLEALLCHRTMLDNIARQLRLQACTGGVRVPAIEAAVAGDHHALFDRLLRKSAEAKGAPFGLRAAETLRCHRSPVAWMA